MLKMLKTGTAVALSLLVLSGCASNVNIKDGGVKQGFMVEQLNVSEAPANMMESLENSILVNSDKEATVVLYGSGSCPPIITEVVDNENQVAFMVKSYGNRPCTMDYTAVPMLVTYTGSDEFSFKDRTFVSCADGSCIRLPEVSEQ